MAFEDESGRPQDPIDLANYMRPAAVLGMETLLRHIAETFTRLSIASKAFVASEIGDCDSEKMAPSSRACASRD
jgi:hypothetical protein